MTRDSVPSGMRSGSLHKLHYIYQKRCELRVKKNLERVIMERDKFQLWSSLVNMSHQPFSYKLPKKRNQSEFWRIFSQNLL